MPVRQIDLFLTNETSDKQYRLTIEREGDGYMLYYANNRRGGVMKPKPKISAPTSLSAVNAKFDEIAAEKRADGYTECTSGAAFSRSENEGMVSGIGCMLPTLVLPEDAVELIHDSAWWAQEKMDGERRLSAWSPARPPIGINRRGLFVPITEPQAMAVRGMADAGVLDGEAMGEALCAFDLLSVNGTDLRQMAFADRYARLTELQLPMDGSVSLVPVARTAAEKQALIDSVRSRKGEGVVFKRADGRYLPGKASSGGSQRKYKFRHSGSFVVTEVNDKRSVRIGVFDSTGRLTPSGNVTILSNQMLPKPGDVLEVSYRYAYRTGALGEPVNLGLRTDIPPEECTVDQLVLDSAAEAA